MRRTALVVALVALLTAACSGGSGHRFVGDRAAAGTQAVPDFEHVIVVVMENKRQHDVLGNRAAPYFNSLARRSAVLSGYGGVAHPSLPNYLALVSGSTQGITTDCTSCVVSAPNLADTLEGVHRTWKAYAEGLPHPGFTGASDGLYAKKHVPFLYFRDVVDSPARLRRVVPLTELSRDLASGRLPDFALVVPNLCHDTHDCHVPAGDAWLRHFLPPLLRKPQLAHSVVFVITDEPCCHQPGTAPVPALAAGTLVKPGSHFTARSSHYGLLRTVEDAWGLRRLGQSRTARPITGVWK